MGEGHGFCGVFLEEWRSGHNRFDQDGELFLVATVDGAVVGMGGLNRDPFVGDPRIARLRRLYVSEDARRRSTGRRLVAALVDHARACCFHAVRVRTHDPVASAFYERLGFEPSAEADATHRLSLLC